MNENNIQYTDELLNVISYLTNEVPTVYDTNILRPEHLILGFLDNNKTYARLILENYMTTENFKDLHTIFDEILLKENTNNDGFISNNDKTTLSFDCSLNDIFDLAEEEAKKTNSKQIGSEHILLSILNPKLELKVGKILNSLGLNYEFLLEKCMIKQPNKIKEKGNNEKPLRNNMNEIPLKDEIKRKQSIGKSEFIEQYTINISNLAKKGKIDDLIGREKELKEIIQVLARRRKNNVILVGKGGVGKTSIVKGLAKMIVDEKVPQFLEGKEVIMLNIMSLVSGTSLRGMFEERVKGLFDELEHNDKYILFIDNMQSVLKSSSKERDTDISDKIGNILEAGNIRVIGAINFKDYRNCIEKDNQLSSKLQKIIIEPSTIDETINILNVSKTHYESYHKVKYSEDVIKKTVLLAEKYINDRCLPDSAFDIIDLAGASKSIETNHYPDNIIKSKRRLNQINNEKSTLMTSGQWEKVEEFIKEENAIKKTIADYDRKLKKNGTQVHEVTENDIMLVLSDLTGVPMSKLSTNEKAKIADIDNILKKNIIGQDEAINTISKVIKRNRIGLGDKTKTMANILMAGSTGCGKTLIAKKIAEEVFGDERALIRIDMSEYSEKNSIAKLTGAAPGYIGYDNGGQLTEAIKNKQHCVLLLDEIEKADNEVYNIFLQLFDDGRLTDSSGQVVNFKNVIVLMTSNVGAKQASELGKGIGFVTDSEANKKNIIEKEIRKKFTPEFINRIDQIVYFNTLTDENLRSIVELELNKFSKRVQNIGYNITYTENVVNYIHGKAVKQKEMGARPIIRLIQHEVEDVLTDILLTDEYEEGHTFNIDYTDKIVIK